MEIKISNVKLMGLLPAHIRSNKTIPANLKRLLAAFLCHNQANYSKTSETGRIAVSADELCTTARISKTSFYLLRTQLEMMGLVTMVKKGESRRQGKKSMASEYAIDLDKLMEPVVSPTAEQMIEYMKKRRMENPSETPSCTAMLCSPTQPTTPLSNTILSNTLHTSTIHSNSLQSSSGQSKAVLSKPVLEDIETAIKQDCNNNFSVEELKNIDSIPNYITEIGEVYKRNDLRNILEYYQKEIVEEQNEGNITIIKQLINNFDFIDNEDKEIFINRIEGWRSRDNSTSYIEATSDPNSFDDFPF